MKIGNHNTKEKVFIVAEAGVNHEGNLEQAERLVVEAKKAGADAVKFQTYLPSEYIARSEIERFERVSRFALPLEAFRRLNEVAQKEGIIFFSTPLGRESVDALKGMVSVFKISSGDINFRPLIQYVASQRKPVIFSSGGASLAEIKQTLSWIEKKTSKRFVKENVAVLHCIAAYPAPIESVNLKSIGYLAEELEITVGYSDHTPGFEVAPLAVAAGARIIEKHFTLSRTGKTFRDHFISLEPREFSEMVKQIRRVEELLGKSGKFVTPVEAENIPSLRRGVAAKKDLSTGSVLSKEDLCFVRPRKEFASESVTKLVGRRVKRPVAQGHLLRPEDLEVVR